MRVYIDIDIYVYIDIAASAPQRGSPSSHATETRCGARVGMAKADAIHMYI